MSKKLLVILITIVLVLGGLTTAAVAIVNSPQNKAKTALKSFTDAKKIEMTFTQSHYGDEVEKTVSIYEKTDSGYKKDESIFSLATDPLSENLYDVTKTSVPLESLDFDFSRFKSKFLCNTKENKNDNGSMTFSAKIKDSRTEKFFGGAVKGVDVSDISIVVEYKGKKVLSYNLRYIVGGDTFNLSAEFFY